MTCSNLEENKHRHNVVQHLLVQQSTFSAFDFDFTLLHCYHLVDLTKYSLCSSGVRPYASKQPQQKKYDKR